MAETPKDVFLASLTFDGSDALKAEVIENVTGAVLKRTTDGAATVEVELYDPLLNLLRSNILNSRVTVQVDSRSFEAVAINKSGENLTWTFEDLIVAEMRRHSEPRKFSPGSVTRAQAAQALLDEIGWIPLAVGANSAPQIKVELARGQLTSAAVDSTSSLTEISPNYDGTVDETPQATSDTAAATKQTQIKEEDREDTWTAIKRWFSEVNWACYADDGKLNVGPESAYIAGDPVFRITDGLPSLVSSVDFDWDIGKPLATASYTVTTDRFAAAPGTCVELYDLGPANGKWFISESTRDLFTAFTEVTLKAPTPELPEPEEPTVDSEATVGDDFLDALGLNDTSPQVPSGTAMASNETWRWPVEKNNGIASGFGPRKAPTAGASTNHAGLDINAKEGDKVLATRDGVVSFTGSEPGYGNYIIINHSSPGGPANGPFAEGRRPGGPSQSLYGHLSKILIGRGAIITQGQTIGLVGHTGRASGPHLHFEIRSGQKSPKAVDPIKVFSGTVIP